MSTRTAVVIQSANTSVYVPESVHPEIKKGLEAIETPEVQEMIRLLSKYGLGVALPHSHGENGNFLPLNNNQVALEAGLRVSFVNKNDPALRTAIPVMWRWDEGIEAVASCALCDLYQHP